MTGPLVHSHVHITHGQRIARWTEEGCCSYPCAQKPCVVGQRRRFVRRHEEVLLPWDTLERTKPSKRNVGGPGPEIDQQHCHPPRPFAAPAVRVHPHSRCVTRNHGCFQNRLPHGARKQNASVKIWQRDTRGTVNHSVICANVVLATKRLVSPRSLLPQRVCVPKIINVRAGNTIDRPCMRWCYKALGGIPAASCPSTYACINFVYTTRTVTIFVR